MSVSVTSRYDVTSACVMFLCIMCVSVSDAQELLVNPGFESGTTGWYHTGFHMQTSTAQVHGGIVSVKCSARSVHFFFFFLYPKADEFLLFIQLMPVLYICRF